MHSNAHVQHTSTHVCILPQLYVVSNLKIYMCTSTLNAIWLLLAALPYIELLHHDGGPYNLQLDTYIVKGFNVK